MNNKNEISAIENSYNMHNIISKKIFNNKKNNIIKKF